MRAYLTGGHGFVASWLIRHLEALGQTIVSTHEPDITDPDAIAKDMADAAPDVVYHLAALASVGQSYRNPRQVFEVNATGTLNVLEAASAIDPLPRVLLVSSSEVYGAVRPEEIPLTEAARLAPVSPYAASKIAAEYLGVQAFLASGLPVVVTRSFNHIGPGQAPNFVVPDLAQRIVEAAKSGGRTLKVGNLSARRDFTDVRDVVRAYRMLAEVGVPGEAYNVCTGRDVAIEELARRMLEIAGADLTFEVDPELMRPVDVPVLRGDNSKLVAGTGWEPEHDLDDTLRDVLAAAQARPTNEPPERGLWRVLLLDRAENPPEVGVPRRSWFRRRWWRNGCGSPSRRPWRPCGPAARAPWPAPGGASSISSRRPSMEVAHGCETLLEVLGQLGQLLAGVGGLLVERLAQLLAAHLALLEGDDAKADDHVGGVLDGLGDSGGVDGRHGLGLLGGRLVRRHASNDSANVYNSCKHFLACGVRQWWPGGTRHPTSLTDRHGRRSSRGRPGRDAEAPPDLRSGASLAGPPPDPNWTSPPEDWDPGTGTIRSPRPRRSPAEVPPLAAPQRPIEPPDRGRRSNPGHRPVHGLVHRPEGDDDPIWDAGRGGSTTAREDDQPHRRSRRADRPRRPDSLDARWTRCRRRAWTTSRSTSTTATPTPSTTSRPTSNPTSSPTSRSTSTTDVERDRDLTDVAMAERAPTMMATPPTAKAVTCLPTTSSLPPRRRWWPCSSPTIRGRGSRRRSRRSAIRTTPTCRCSSIDAGSDRRPDRHGSPRCCPPPSCGACPTTSASRPRPTRCSHVVEGASHFVFCHDDVAPAPDAIRLMVEEAFRSNAGVVAPKLVDWDDAERLLAGRARRRQERCAGRARRGRASSTRSSTTPCGTSSGRPAASRSCGPTCSRRSAASTP